MSEGLTLQLAGRVAACNQESIPDDVQALARQCVLDTIGVALAGVDQPVSRILRNEIREEASASSAGLIGRSARVSVLSAALLNGTAAHALDYDDVHMAIPGHASAAIVPATLALAEETGASGEHVTTAVVAGFEAGCRLGVLLSPGHYAEGFHATGTIGAIAAAAACARLMGLDATRTAHALGIASAQAAGLKAMMGTMCKPLNAGRAAYNGVLSARLASRGFTSRLDALECQQGFADTHSPDFHPDRALAVPPNGFYLRSNIFKFHASCVLTHAPIEALRKIRARHRLVSEEIVGVVIRIDRAAEKVCRFPKPSTPLEAKFSLPFAAALTILDRETGRPETFADETLTAPDIVALRDKTHVEYVDGWPMTLAEVEVHLINGEVHIARHDAGLDLPPAAELTARIRQKFLQLAVPIIGGIRAAELARLVETLNQLVNIGSITRLWVPLG